MIQPQYCELRVLPARYYFLKRTMDLGFCLLVAPAVLAILAMCGAFIYLQSPGPIFFVQYRTGKGGRRFPMYKLRTMVTNAEEMKQQLLHLNALTYPDFKIKDDPRIFPVGKFLRKTSLDELPQLFNILKGQMSLVGPRPTSFEADTYDLQHTERLEVTPGLTGLWQVSGRSDVDFDERVRMDIEYIENRSLWMDTKLLVLTIAEVVRRRGAC